MSDSNPDKHRQAMEVLCDRDFKSLYQTSLILRMNPDLTSLQSIVVRWSLSLTILRFPLVPHPNRDKHRQALKLADGLGCRVLLSFVGVPV